MNLVIINKTRKRIKKTFVQKVVKKTLGIFGKKIRNFSLSVIFVDREEIRSINRIYRKENKPTDILSFNYSSGYNKKQRKNEIEGELVICPGIVEKLAKENRVSFQKELAFVISHGILHLLGMKHGREMYEMQDRVMLICE